MSDIPSLQQVCEDYCYEVLVHVGGNKTAAAKELQITKMTLYRYLKLRETRLRLFRQQEAQGDVQHAT